MSAGTEPKNKWMALICVVVVWMAGCFTKRPPVNATVPHYVPFERPVIPVATAAALDAPPDLSTEVPEAPAELAVAPSAPAKPHVAAPPVAEPSRTEKTPEPVIAPDLTTQEVSEARAETQRNLDMMEKNLTLAWGRKLNASQQDLVSKVRSFAENAKEAGRGGDWVRAKNLSRKAEVLSEELAASL